MADYISREDAVDELQVKVFHNLTDEYYGTMQVLTELPAADVVPVVRCKDCKHLGITTLGSYWCQNENGCAKPTPNGFCSYGERKE